MVKTIIEFLRVLAWPVVALVFFFAARRPLSALISGLRLRSAPTPWGSFEFGPSLLDKERVTDSADPAENLYWLGHDLMWTVDVTLRGAGRKFILHGLGHSLQNLRAVGLSDTPQEEILTKLQDKVSRMLDTELDESLRNSLVREVQAVQQDVGRLAATQKGDSTPSRH